MEGRINDAEDCVRKALDLIPLLISNAFYTKVFTGRWQAIASKLQLLNQTMTAIIKEPSCCYWSENSLLEELLSKVVSTLQVARELVKCCRVLSCSWKLMKQSDLDVLVDKLSFHQRDLQVLIKSGLLRESNDASVVSRPGLGARRDAVVLFLRGLFAKIQIGNTQLKEQALFVLVQILLEDGNNIDVVADEKLDIGFLVHLLYSHIVTLREYSVVAVSILVHSDPCKACLVGEGVIAPLIGILESGSCVAKEKAAEALLELTVNSDKASVNVGMNVTLGICRCNYGEDIDRENACAITAYCGLSALVENCKCGSPEGQAIASAVLRNLAFVEEIRGPMAEEGAIPVLINLVNCGTTLAQESSAQCLYLLASNHEKLRQKICLEGGVESLVLLLERAPSPEAQEIILKTIHSLSATTCSISLLMSSGFVNDLTVLLGSERVEIQELAAMIICNLSRTEETKRALGGAGCIGLLANMLDGEPSFSHAIAARALSSLLAVDCNRKEFVKNDENVYCLVQLLDPKNDTVSNVFLISALLALSHSSSGRKKMACAGAYQHLEKLAEMEVGGAKKVLHKMTTKYKLRKMLSSKW